MDKHFTFDDMINTMMPLPISGNANGEGIYCRGQELVASMDQPKETARQEKETRGICCKLKTINLKLKKRLSSCDSLFYVVSS